MKQGTFDNYRQAVYLNRIDEAIKRLEAQGAIEAMERLKKKRILVEDGNFEIQDVTVECVRVVGRLIAELTKATLLRNKHCRG